jgi:hypothetical protein
MVFPKQTECRGSVTFDDDEVEDDEQRETTETSSEDADFSNVKPLSPRSPGGRTVSTQARLQRQGLKKSKSGGTNFVVQSIRRGSDDWRGMLKPFVSDLVFRSLFRQRFQGKLTNASCLVCCGDSSYSRQANLLLMLVCTFLCCILVH